MSAQLKAVAAAESGGVSSQRFAQLKNARLRDFVERSGGGALQFLFGRLLLPPPPPPLPPHAVNANRRRHVIENESGDSAIEFFASASAFQPASILMQKASAQIRTTLVGRRRGKIDHTSLLQSYNFKDRREPQKFADDDESGLAIVADHSIDGSSADSARRKMTLVDDQEAVRFFAARLLPLAEQSAVSRPPEAGDRSLTTPLNDWILQPGDEAAAQTALDQSQVAGENQEHDRHFDSTVVTEASAHDDFVSIGRLGAGATTPSSFDSEVELWSRGAVSLAHRQPLDHYAKPTPHDFNARGGSTASVSWRREGE